MGPIVTWAVNLLTGGTGRPVGDQESPGAVPDFPYAVVSVMQSDFAGPALYSPEADADVGIQVDSVGTTVEQARWMSDSVRRTLVARINGGFQVKIDDPSGYQIADRQTDGGPQPPIPEGSSASRVYTVPERFTIRVTAGDNP